MDGGRKGGREGKCFLDEGKGFLGWMSFVHATKNNNIIKFIPTPLTGVNLTKSQPASRLVQITGVHSGFYHSTGPLSAGNLTPELAYQYTVEHEISLDSTLGTVHNILLEIPRGLSENVTVIPTLPTVIPSNKYIPFVQIRGPTPPPIEWAHRSRQPHCKQTYLSYSMTTISTRATPSRI